MIMRPRSDAWIGKVVVLGLGAAVLALSGCQTLSSSLADRPTVRPEEMTDAGGQPCPEDLPLGDDPSGHGFGVERAASQLPNLLEPQEAWLCRYDFFDRDQVGSVGGVFDGGVSVLDALGVGRSD